LKIASTTEDMEQRRLMLTNHVVVITEEGPMRVQLRDKIKAIIMHQFGIRMHGFHIYRSYSKTFIAIFSESHDRNVVFATGRALDGRI
jgi:hypothetical protein